jgi:predicted DNA-binding protein
MSTDKSHQTSRGIEITDEVIEKLVEEAEAGYDPKILKNRGGRPPLGSAPASVVAVRLDPDLRTAVEAQAEADGTTASDIIRRAIRAYVHVA